MSSIWNREGLPGNIDVATDEETLRVLRWTGGHWRCRTR